MKTPESLGMTPGCHCGIEQRLRSRATMNRYDLLRTTRSLLRAPDSAKRLADLKRVQESKTTVEEALRLHTAECALCFGRTFGSSS
jgi:hypothetical protein